jgi:hypothetical protein
MMSDGAAGLRSSVPGSLNVYVADADATFQLAARAAAEIIV